MMKVKYYKCPLCEKKFKTLNGWGNHMETNHPGSTPEGYSISRYFYFTVTGKTSGKCRTCKGDTPWNEKSMKYDQYCTNPECKKAYAKMAKQRMIGKYGKTHLLNDPEMQKKMLGNRGISGKYRFQDGQEFEYVGSYERNFLQMLDTFLQWHSNDLMAPSPHVYYYDYKNEVDKENEGRKFYIPDFYIPSLNLEIEIKQQTSTNEKFNEINRVKEKMKDAVMESNKQVNYLKLNDNNFEPFFQFIMKANEYLPTPENIRKNQMDLVMESFNNIPEEVESVFGEMRDATPDEDRNIMKHIRTISEPTCIDFWDDIEKNPVMEEANYSSTNKYPVFIVLMHSGTILANVIRNFTKDDFSHACISFNSKLDPLYSFGNKKTNIIDPGFVIQNPTSYFYKRHNKTVYAVYVMYVSKESYDKMQEGLQFFIGRKDELKYDLFNLMSVWHGKPSEDSKRYFCSRFVMEIIGKGRENEKVPSLWRPQEISTLDDITMVNKGVDFYQYDYTITEKNLALVQKKKFANIVLESNGSSEVATNESHSNLNLCKIIACYAGVGKNRAIELLEKDGYRVNSIEKLRDFYKKYPTPSDYVNEINRLAKKSDFLFIPYFMNMEERYLDGNVNYYLIYPNIKCKSKFIKRFKDLDFTKDQIEYLSDNWDEMITDCIQSNIPDCNKIEVNYDEFVYDVIKNLFLPATESQSYIPEVSSNEIATEGFLSLFGFGKSSPHDQHHTNRWKELFNLDMEKNLFGSSFSGVKIHDGMIEVHGINYSTLKGRIKRFYQDKSIYNIFLPKYNAISYKRFERKRIQRSAIKIDYLYTPEFFALELVNLFTDLGKRFKDRNYLSMAAVIYRNSWLKVADDNVDSVPYLNTSKLSNLSLALNSYQKEFIEKYPKLKAQLNLNGYILAFEQGLGKTLTAIALSECLDVDHVYIVCPNSLKENWALELQKYYIKYQEDEDLWRQEVFICTGKSIFFDKNTTKFIITNNESIDKMFPYVMDGKNMLILDESHNFRNINSKRVNQLISLRDKLNCVDTLVMSGTPIKATPDEIVPALMLIDPTLTAEAAECFSKAFKLHSSLGTSLVQNRFGKIMYRKEKDVLDGKLPSKFIENFDVMIRDRDKYVMEEVTKVVMEYYHALYNSGIKPSLELKDEFFDITRRYTPRPNSFKDFSRIITEITKDPDLYLHEIDKLFIENYMTDTRARIDNKNIRDRYDYLIKNYVRFRNHCLGVAFGAILPKYRRDMFISMYDENKHIFFNMINDCPKKTLIFSQFKDVANYIYDDLNAHDIGAVLITGDVKNRLEVLKAFKESDSVRVLVATSQTIGTGVTLVEASQMFFFGPPWRQSDFDQCSDRIHRIGQTDDCFVYTVTLNTGDALNLSTRMDNILNWSKSMTESVISKTEDDANLDETNFENILKADESYQPVVENYVFSKKPIRYRVNEFESGMCNVLLVTGLSGSGKSTIGKSYADKDPNVEWIELDWFEKNYGMTDAHLKECAEPLYQYLTKDPTGIAFRKQSLSDNKPGGKELQQSIRLFGDWLLKYCSTHRNVKWVIEGVQIYSCFDFNLVKKYPIIIVGTSMTKSIVRRLRRDEYEKEFIKMCQWYYDEEKSLNKFRNDIKNEQVTKFDIVSEGVFSELDIELQELLGEFIDEPVDEKRFFE